MMGEEEMVTLPAKSLATILSAIRNLQENKGSSPREIVNYISAVHSLPPETVRRKMQTVLKRGVAHGILREVDGRYSLPIDTESESLEVAEQELGLLDFCSKVRKRKLQGRKMRRLPRKNKARTYRGRSASYKSRQTKTKKRMLGERKKSKTRKKSKKIMSANQTPNISEQTEISSIPVEAPTNNVEKIRLQSRTPFSSRRSSCVREVGPETLSVA